MRRRLIISLILVLMGLPTMLHAAIVYLKNGDEIECSSFKRVGDRVFVQINDRSKIDFAASEVDLGKTMGLQSGAGSTTNAAHAHTAEIDGPIARQKLQRDVYALFAAKRFQDLENLAESFRSKDERLPEGHAKLYYFYRTFQKPPVEGPVKWDRMIRGLEQWRHQFPRSLTARVATAQAWITYGWEARGHGYASSVTREGWRLLEERIAKAYDLVKEPPPAGESDCPGRLQLLLVIGKTQGWPKEQFDETFREAVRLAPDYTDFYATAMSYQTSRWGGQPEAWLDFINQADAIAGNPDSREVYVRLLAGGYRKEWKTFNEPRLPWSKMKKGFLDIQKRFPGSPFTLNNFAKFACIAGDAEIGRELFMKIGDAPYFASWERNDPDFDKCRERFGVSGLSRREIYLRRMDQESVQTLALAQQGDAFSQHSVAVDFYKGDSAKPKDYRLAFTMAKAAADQGYAPAQTELALMYQSSTAVRRDDTVALMWMEKAAEQGEVTALVFLPNMYEKQQKNYQKAYAWYLAAWYLDMDKELARKDMERVERFLAPKQIADAKREGEAIAKRIAATK